MFPVHVISLFYEVNESLRFNESLTELFYVGLARILVEVKDLVGRCLAHFVIGRNWTLIRWIQSGVINITQHRLSIFRILLIEVFKVIYQIQYEIQKQLFYFQGELAIVSVHRLYKDRFVDLKFWAY